MRRMIYVITHPEVIIDPQVPVPRWPLSHRGRERMRKMLAQPWLERVGAIYCSMEQKAIDGAQVLADYLSLEFEMVEDLGEIDRSATGYLPAEEHAAAAKEVFVHPARSMRGWETANAAQQRMVQAMEWVIAQGRGPGDVAVVAHGGVATFYLCHLKGLPIRWEERQPGSGGGNYYCFDAEARVLVHGWRPIDGENASIRGHV